MSVIARYSSNPLPFISSTCSAQLGSPPLDSCIMLASCAIWGNFSAILEWPASPSSADSSEASSVPARTAASSNHSVTQSCQVGYGFTFSAGVRSVSITLALHLPRAYLVVPSWNSLTISCMSRSRLPLSEDFARLHINSRPVTVRRQRLRAYRRWSHTAAHTMLRSVSGKLILAGG